MGELRRGASARCIGGLFVLAGCEVTGVIGDIESPDAAAVAPVVVPPRDASAGEAGPTPDGAVIDAGLSRDVTAAMDVARMDVVAPRDVTAPRPDVRLIDASGLDAWALPIDVVTRPADAPRPAPTRPLRAFPGAEGFGATATGGRGGRVIFVTNLNASGPGSLQDALNQTGRRYILFRVSGVINERLELKSGDVTVAGQTSPGGITLRGLKTEEARYCDQQCGTNVQGVQNVILRHLRLRPANPAYDDALRIRYARNVIADHLSMGNATDEAVEVSFSNNVTLQECILAETVGDHADRGGLLLNYSNPPAGYALDRISLLRNAWVRIRGRYPEVSRESPAAAGTTMLLEVSNNLIWDQQFYMDVKSTNGLNDDNGAPVYYQLNWIGNQGFVRRGYGFGMINMRNPTGRSTAFFEGNRLDAYSNRLDWALNYCCNDYPAVTMPPRAPAWARTARHPFPDVTYLTPDRVRPYAVENAGAFPRDPMDTRLMAAVSRGVIDTAPADRNPANDALATVYPAGRAPVPPPDSDDDGMPDVWERAMGLDPLAQDHNGTELSVSLTGAEGYTNLECYLNELATRRR